MAGLFDDDFCQNVGGKNKLGSYAHFPGTGPEGATCATCEFARRDRTRLYCDKWTQLMRQNDASIVHGSPINGNARACKYFEDRK